MSARFSTSSFFDNIPPATRGRSFATRAQSLYEAAFTHEKRSQPSLPLLQGCILLSFYEQTDHPAPTSWFIIGACTRLALELDLQNIDAKLDIEQCPSPQGGADNDVWTTLEEKRRAWWLTWELDVFASTLLRRPQCIDKNNMSVMLPVQDSQWFTDTLVPSTMMNSNVTQIWSTLQDNMNLGARAWFLVATFLMAKAHDFVLHKDVTIHDIIALEASVSCFTLLLPPELDLSTVSSPIPEQDFASYNWTVSLIFMLHT